MIRSRFGFPKSDTAFDVENFASCLWKRVFRAEKKECPPRTFLKSVAPRSVKVKCLSRELPLSKSVHCFAKGSKESNNPSAVLKSSGSRRSSGFVKYCSSDRKSSDETAFGKKLFQPLSNGIAQRRITLFRSEFEKAYPSFL